MTTENLRQCLDCNLILPQSSYYDKKDKKNANICKCCLKRKRRINDIQKTYEMPLEEYEARYKAQDARCYICRQKESNPRLLGNIGLELSIDHNHKTNMNRDLLCNRCNMMVGNVDENPEILQAIIQYIYRHKAEYIKLQEQKFLQEIKEENARQ